MINWRRANQVQGRGRGLGEGKKIPFKVFASSAKMASIFGPVISQRLRSQRKINRMAHSVADVLLLLLLLRYCCCYLQCRGTVVDAYLCKYPSLRTPRF